MMHQVKSLYEFGIFRLDPAERLLLRDNKRVALTSKVFDILTILVENSGHLLEKDVLMQAIWPDTVVEEGNLTRCVSTLREALGEGGGQHKYIETVPKRGYRFVADVKKVSDQVAEANLCERAKSTAVIEGESNSESTRLPDDLDAFSFHHSSGCHQLFEPLGGAVPLDSEFYIARPTDGEFQSAIAQGDSIVLVKGARQVGKTSLLARALEQARVAGARVAVVDFQMLNSSHLENAGTLLLALAEVFADQLELDVSPEDVWNPNRGPSVNLERYLRHEALNKTSSQLVLGLDEIDRLFACDFANEVFGLFRSWHNRRALDPAGPWRRLTLAIAYATEAHLFITDLNQSPFNVGTRLLLEDFTLEQLAELNRRYGFPLRNQNEVADYARLVGGHPYLAQRGLYEIAVQGALLADLQAHADSDQGPFGDHLHRLLISLSEADGLCEAVREVLEGRPCPDAESFYRLRSAGALSGDSQRDAKLRCELYAGYLRKHL